MMLLVSFSAYILLPSLALAQSTCIYQGKSYTHYGIFKHANSCTSLQCQNGSIAVIEEACGKDVDGNCHGVNVQFISSNQLYVCTKSSSGGQTVYKNELGPLPSGASCTTNGNTYQHLEQFVLPNGCQVGQCQSGNVVTLKPADAQKASKETLYKCVEVVENGVKVRKSVVALPVFSPCIVGTQKYIHLQIYTSGNGCEKSQCQNGKAVIVETLCRNAQGVCFGNNYLWEENGQKLQCINDPSWGWIVARIFEKPEKPVPVCYTPGKDIIYLIDESGSVGLSNFQLLKQFTSQLTRRFYLGVNISNAEFLFGAVKFSSQPTKVFNLNQYLTQSSLSQVKLTEYTYDPAKSPNGVSIRYFCLCSMNSSWGKENQCRRYFQIYMENTDNLLSMSYSTGGTATDKGLDYILNYGLFNPAVGGRTNAEKVIIVLTDGQSNVPTATQVSALRVRNSKITILCVGVGKGVNVQELNGMAGNPDNVVFVESFDAIDKVEDKVSKKVCFYT